jgi:hypothetical protein
VPASFANRPVSLHVDPDRLVFGNAKMTTTPRSPDPPLPHPRDRKRQLPLQGQLRGRQEKAKGGTRIDQNLTADKPTQPGQSSVKIPGQFATEINRLPLKRPFVPSVALG